MDHGQQVDAFASVVDVIRDDETPVHELPDVEAELPAQSCVNRVELGPLGELFDPVEEAVKPAFDDVVGNLLGAEEINLPGDVVAERRA